MITNKKKTEREKFNEMMKIMQERGCSTDEWEVSLLSSIAASLAIIADNMKALKLGEVADNEQ